MVSGVQVGVRHGDKPAQFVHSYVPGLSSWSPSSKSLRVKSVGWYLGLCQNQKRLRLTTSAMETSFLESFTRDTWMRLPSGSIWWTKLAVALENMARVDEGCRQLEEGERARDFKGFHLSLFCTAEAPRAKRRALMLVSLKNLGWFPVGILPRFPRRDKIYAGLTSSSETEDVREECVGENHVTPNLCVCPTTTCRQWLTTSKVSSPATCCYHSFDQRVTCKANPYTHTHTSVS